MIKEGRDYMLSLLSKEKMSGNKKIIENLVLFLVLFIIVIVVINTLVEPNTKTVQSESEIYSKENYIAKTEMSLEEKLEEILSLISGAGKVNVLITYFNGIEQVPMYDTKQNTTTIQESDKEGGNRKTQEVSTEQNIIFNEENNNKTPVIKQIINPKVTGVIVVADGADNMVIKEKLINAVEASLDVPTHKIQVFARNSNT